MAFKLTPLVHIGAKSHCKWSNTQLLASTLRVHKCIFNCTAPPITVLLVWKGGQIWTPVSRCNLTPLPEVTIHHIFSWLLIDDSMNVMIDFLIKTNWLFFPHNKFSSEKKSRRWMRFLHGWFGATSQFAHLWWLLQTVPLSRVVQGPHIQ